MAFIVQRKVALGILIAGFALCVLILVWRDAAHRLTTDVLDLMPASDASPELSLIKGLASDRQSRVVLVAIDSANQTENEGALQRARDAVEGALKGSGAFEDVETVGSSADRDAVGVAVFDRRLDLLGPGWLAERWNDYEKAAPGESWSAWLAETTAARLESFLARPEAVAFQDIVQKDPLLLVPGAAERLQSFGSASPEGFGKGLIWALARQSALSKEGQESVASAMDAAARMLAGQGSGFGLRWTGVVRIAARSREQIQAEVSRLNLLSLAAVLAVAFACVRNPLKALALAPVVLLSILGALTAVVLVFETVHILVLVLGSLLCGVAIDYGFYIYLQPPLRAGEPYEDKLRRLLRPLLSSSLTVVLGFSLLLASNLPLIREIGVFVSGGLLAALAGAILWFALLGGPYLETRPFVRRRMGASGFRTPALIVTAVIGLVAVLGPWRLHWRDDIRDLQIRDARLAANDEALRSRFGDSEEKAVYLTGGADAAEARDALDRFLAWHEREFPGAATASIGVLLPETADWKALPSRISGLGSFDTDLRAALTRHGFDSGSFADFFTQWDRWVARKDIPPYDALILDFAAALKGPLALAISERPGSCVLTTIGSHPPGAEPPATTRTFSTHGLESLNSLFSRYRLSALHLSAVGLALVGLSVFLIYGFRNGLAIFSIPCGSCLFAFGFLGCLGRPIDLFNLLGAFLGVCLAHNYAIFTWENSARGEIPPPSIRLSAFCTAASFGVLGLSAIPVVAALGTTVAITVLAALILVETLPLLRTSHA